MLPPCNTLLSHASPLKITEECCAIMTHKSGYQNEPLKHHNSTIIIKICKDLQVHSPATSLNSKCNKYEVLTSSHVLGQQWIHYEVMLFLHHHLVFPASLL